MIDLKPRPAKPGVALFMDRKTSADPIETTIDCGLTRAADLVSRARIIRDRCRPEQVNACCVCSGSQFPRNLGARSANDYQTHLRRPGNASDLVAVSQTHLAFLDTPSKITAINRDMSAYLSIRVKLQVHSIQPLRGCSLDQHRPPRSDLHDDLKPLLNFSIFLPPCSYQRIHAGAGRTEYHPSMNSAHKKTRDPGHDDQGNAFPASHRSITDLSLVKF